MFLIVSVSSHCWSSPEGILNFFHIHSSSYLTLDNASAFLCFLPSLYIISKSYGCSILSSVHLLHFCSLSTYNFFISDFILFISVIVFSMILSIILLFEILSFCL